MSGCECKPDRAQPSINIALRGFAPFFGAFHVYDRLFGLGDPGETVCTKTSY
jgi:hypothetical protein